MRYMTQDMKEKLKKDCSRCMKRFEKNPNVSMRTWVNGTKFCSISCAKRGNKNRLGISYPAWNKGIPGPRGDKNPSWKGGKTKLSKVIRTSMQYKNWRDSVYERDNYTCVECGNRNGNGKKVVLNADHIEAFSLIMRKHGVDSFQAALICADLWDISNGRTLCRPCHEKTPNFGTKALKT